MRVSFIILIIVFGVGFLMSRPIPLWGQETQVEVQVPEWEKWKTELESLKKQKLSLNLHRTDLESKMNQLQAGLSGLTDSTEIAEVEAQLATWRKEVAFFKKKEARLLQKIEKLQAKIEKAQQVYAKASIVEDLLKNGGKKKWDWKKGIFGGNFGASWGGFHNPKEYYVNISPQVGYKIAKKHSIGLGLSYISEQRRLQTTAPVGSDVSLVGSEVRTETSYASNTIYGLKTFSRWALGKSFFVEGQAEALNGKTQSGVRNWQPALWAGTGYQLSVGKHWGLNLMLRYNVLHDENSFYRSAMDFQVGIQLPGNGSVKAQRKSSSQTGSRAEGSRP